MDPARTQETMQRFAAEVMPAFAPQARRVGGGGPVSVDGTWDEARTPQETWPDCSPRRPTLYGCPSADHPAELRADIAFLGVPYDQGTSFRPGARLAPDALRATRTYPYHSFGDGSPASGTVDADSGEVHLQGVTMADCGDVPIVPANLERNFARVTRAVRTIRSTGAIPVVLGGDHSITSAVVRAFDEVEELDVFHLDAHIDFNDHVQGLCWGHGAVIRRLCEQPFVRHITHIGIRSTTQGNLRDTLDLGNTVIGTERIRSEGPRTALAGIASPRPTYVTIDIDVLDPSIAPGTGTPAPGGLTYFEVRDVLRRIGAARSVVGVDLVEVSPPYDSSEITALVAAQLLVDLLAAACSPDEVGTLAATNGLSGTNGLSR